MKDNTYIEKFVSGDEKSDFAEFVKDKYANQKTHILGDTWDQVKSIFIGEEDFWHDRFLFYGIFDCIIGTFAGLLLGMELIVILCSMFIVGICDVVISGITNDRFRGFTVLLASIISSPIIAVKNTVKKISEKLEHKRKLKAIKNAPIVEEKKEEPKTVDELKSDIKESIDDYLEHGCLYENNSGNNLSKFVDGVKYAEKNISKLYDESIKIDYYGRLSALINLFDRVRKLRGSRLEEASLYLYKQLNNLCGCLENTLTFNNISPETKKIVQQMKIEPYYSKVRD